MSELLQTKKGFNLSYELVDFSSIRVTKKGKNEQFEWGDSLTFRASNVYTVEDEEVGMVDKEEILEFKIPCQNLSESAELNKVIRLLQANGVVLNLNGFLPRKIDGNPILQVTITDTPESIFQKYHEPLKKISQIQNKAS